MNTSKVELPNKEPEKLVEKKKVAEKNIRDIYLQAVKHNKGFKRQSKKKGISNLANDERGNSFSGSSYLEKEYSLVQRILSDTKELKNIKIKNDAAKNEQNQVTRLLSTPKYKSPEEYYQEVLQLKKTIKLLENNEMINKAKMEYYENEMAKKEQEILDLLDVKKTEVISIAESKSDVSAIIYGLKQKAYKLEFSLKRKDAEYNKLKNELATTNMRELKMQNERLGVELAKALMNDKKIIEAFDKRGVPDYDGSSFYDSEKHRSVSELSLNKSQIMKQNIAKQLQGDNFDDSNDFISKFKFENKIVLKGTLKEKLDQLDERETELLKEISKLNEEIDNLRRNKSSMGSSASLTKGDDHKKKKNIYSDSDSNTNISESDSDSEHTRKTSKDSARISTIKKLQSVMRGHIHRSSSLNREIREKEEREREREEYERDRLKRRSPSPRRRRSPIERSPPRGRSPRRGSFDQRRSRSNVVVSDEDDDNPKKELIPNKDPKNEEKGESVCCSPFCRRKK